MEARLSHKDQQTKQNKKILNMEKSNHLKLGNIKIATTTKIIIIANVLKCDKSILFMSKNFYVGDVTRYLELSNIFR